MPSGVCEADLQAAGDLQDCLRRRRGSACARKALGLWGLGRACPSPPHTCTPTWYCFTSLCKGIELDGSAQQLPGGMQQGWAEPHKFSLE